MIKLLYVISLHKLMATLFVFQPKTASGENVVKCRYDWHQTASTVTVAIYCKRYDPFSSTVEVGPIRLRVAIHLPEEGGVFKIDAELKGVRQRLY